MSKSTVKAHPYHYSVDKNIVQQFIDWLVPLGLFWVYFEYYNFGKFTPSEMVKTTGLMAIALLALTLIAGPLARFIPSLDILKAHRKFWGITSFLFLLLHFGLVIIFYFKFNLFRLIDPSNPKSLGLTTGLIATIILLLVTLTSNRKALKNLDPKVWKAIQTTSYLALIFALAHFFLMEQVNGVLTIKRFLGQATFAFATFVVIFRLIILFLPQNRKS